jgi:multiple sugar transport system permease protein
MKYRNLPIYLALIALAALFLFPFYWVVISSLKSVEGMSLKPPAMFPAEVKTESWVERGVTVFEMEDERWAALTGDFAVQLTEDGKPTQLVRELPADRFPVGGADLSFERVPVYNVEGKTYTVVARMVRQGEDTFSETLFAVPEGERTLAKLEVLENVANQEVRGWSAHPDNFKKALEGPEATIGGESSGFLLFMRNSLFISTMAVLGQILASSLVAFGFARMRFKGREFLFILLIATLMVPAQVTLIPLFTIYKTIGWVDTFLPLIVPHFAGGAFNIFLIRQFMLGFPKELDESASLDGATPFRIYWSVILPNCAPVLIVVGLFTFVGTWQDVMGPLIYLDNPNYRTVTLGLEYFRSPYVDNRPLLMAGAVLAMLPVALLFLVAQRYIMSGISTTGMK